MGYNRGAGNSNFNIRFWRILIQVEIYQEYRGLYDGTSWATTSPATLGTIQEVNLGGTGTSSLALAAGGGSSSTATEEYTGAGPETKTITVS
jgi:hypothetical protein